MTEPLYRRLLAERYDALPGAVRRLHDVRGKCVWRGEGTVTRGPSLIARALAATMSLPPATEPGTACPVEVTFTPDGRGGETWSRTFAAGPGPWRAFVSHQSQRAGLLSERVLFTRFGFELVADARGLRLETQRFHVLGVPVPCPLQPRIATLESEQDGRYHFDVEAHLPLGLGLLVRYLGWLEDAGSG